jgi:hypothetical protein
MERLWAAGLSGPVHGPSAVGLLERVMRPGGLADYGEQGMEPRPA